MNKIGIVSLFILLGILQGCAGVAVVGAAGAVSAANDNRTAGQMVEDQAIELKTIQAFSSDKALSRASNISAISYNGILLLVGQTTSPQYKDRATQLARQVEKVRSVHNQIELMEPVGLKQKMRDAWLTTRIKSTLLSAQGIASLNIKIVVRNEVLYLMGIVSRKEAESVVKAVLPVKGIRRIVQVFEYKKG